MFPKRRLALDICSVNLSSSRAGVGDRDVGINAKMNNMYSGAELGGVEKNRRRTRGATVIRYKIVK